MRMPLKFCANLSFMFQESSSLLERYELARKAGFKAVETGFPYDFASDEVKEAKLKSGLEQVLINVYPGDLKKGELGWAALAGKTNEFKQSLEKAIEYAKKLDCKRIHIMSGTVEKETPENLKVLEENLKTAVGILQQNEILGVIEPINNYSVPKYFLNNYDKALSVIKSINSPYLKLQLDLFHLQHISGNLTKNIENLLPFVGHIQVAQVPDRHEPNTPGEINYRYVFSLLEKLNYNGWIGLEYIPKANTNEGLNWIQEMGYTL